MRTSSLLAPLFLALSACGSVEVIDTLSGTVVDGQGAPAPDVRVKVGDSLVTTDAAGHFTVSAVSSPYDVTLIPKDLQTPYIFLGLTGSDPTLVVYDRRLNPAQDGQSATILLDLPVDPAAHEQFSFIVDRPDDLSPIGVANANPTPDGQILITVSWPESKSTTVRIQALRYTVDGGGTQHYTGYDTTTLPLAGGIGEAWTANWKAPSFKEAKISASIDLPDGYQIWQSEVNMRPGGGPSGGIVAWKSSNSTDPSFVVPDLEGALFDVTVCATNGASASCRTLPGLTAGTLGAKLSVEEGPALLSPSSGESVGAGSEVQWAAQGEGASFLLFYPPGGAAGPWYFIASGDEAATIPDLTALGTKLPSGADYNIGVFRNGAEETVDDLAKHGPFFAPRDKAATYAYSNTVTVKTR
jgi:hypothetical protein